MSYDIYLFKPRDGESVEDAHERVVEGDDRPATADKEALKERLAGALVGCWTGLERFEFDYGLIAESYEMTEDEARWEFRHIELNSPEGGSGVQITIEDESATILIPYWHQGDAARGVFEEALQYLKVFEKEAGYVAYDPQLDKPLDPSTDLAESLAAYSGVATAIPFTPSEADSEEPKPWWKFW